MHLRLALNVVEYVLQDKMAIVQREVQSLRASENASTKETIMIAELKTHIKAQDKSIGEEVWFTTYFCCLLSRAPHVATFFNNHSPTLTSRTIDSLAISQRPTAAHASTIKAQYGCVQLAYQRLAISARCLDPGARRSATARRAGWS